MSRHPLETYLSELRNIRSSGATVKETSYYSPLANLFNEIDKALKPKVRCILPLKNQGAGLPGVHIKKLASARKNQKHSRTWLTKTQ